MTKDEIRSKVQLKFTNSEYIKRRTLPDGAPSGTPKFRPEEVEYWTTLISNSNWDMSTGSTLFDTEFDKTYSIDHSKSALTIPQNNYIGQTFYIPKKGNEYGIYISSIAVFTAIEDESATLTLDIRPLVNGIPSDALPLGSTTVQPLPNILVTAAERKIWDPAPLTNPSDQLSKREFEFEYPVYLSSGGPGAEGAYYCFTLTTNSKNYEVYISESGKPTLVSGNILSNPYLGDFIYSSQGESWVIDPTKDLCFEINRAEFAVGTESITFNIPKQDVDFPYDELNLNVTTSQINEIAYISNSTASVNKFNTDVMTTIQTPINSRVISPYTSSLNITDGLTFTVELTNTNSKVTPTIDTRAGVTLTRNYIDPYSTEISDAELLPPSKNGIEAFAKYMTRPVVLNEGFDADGITVYVDVNKPIGTEIEIFYRILNRYDASVAFSDSRWYRMTKKTTETPALLSDEYAQETYEDLNIVYYSGGAEYNTFNQLAIKVVFYSDNSTVIPTIKNLRAIATV
jgi:hypothetical protein